MKRIFAIGMKKWVELREAKAPPKARTTEVVKIVKHKVYEGGWYDDDYRWRMREREVPRRLKISTTTHSGGKVIKTIKAAQFARLTKIALRAGGMVELMPEQIEKVLGHET